MPQAKDGNPFPVLYFAAPSYRNLLQRRLPFRHHTFSTGIADDKWKLIGLQLSRIHQVTQFTFIHGGTDDHMRYATHVGNIISTMMRGAVFTYQARPVQAEDNRQLLDRRVMDHLVIRSLHEGRINITEYTHALGRH